MTVSSLPPFAVAPSGAVDDGTENGNETVVVP